MIYASIEGSAYVFTNNNFKRLLDGTQIVELDRDDPSHREIVAEKEE